MNGLLDTDESIIDQDNRARTERLALKLARLKNVAVDIEEESRDHIPMLDDVDSSYERALISLRSGHSRLVASLKPIKRSRLLLLIFMVLILLYYIMYWLLGSKT